MPVKPTESEEAYFARLEMERRTHALAAQESRATAEERQRILAVARGRGIETRLEVVTEQDADVGIVHAAGRLGVDAICMATHGHAGLSQLVLGSQAHAVVQRARQPVLLVPPERGE